MNILLIDDQPEVIEGILVGVNWKSLDIDKIFKAYDIFEAQTIVKQNQIDVMLCDIEMPLGTGLELYEWVNTNKYRIKCIFLTAHSDFAYAQQAVKLQGFDYLLQPVTYLQIEDSIQSAIDKIKMESVMDDYYQYGIMLKKREDLSVGNMLRDYLLMYNNDAEKIAEYLKMMSFEINCDTVCQSNLIQILSWDNEEKWDNNLFLYAINNILKELMEGYADKMTVVPIDKVFYYLIYVTNDDNKNKTINRIMWDFINLCKQYFGCTCAIYEGKPDAFLNQPEVFASIKALTHHNVTNESKVFSKEEIASEKLGYVSPDFAKWETLVQQGCCNAVYAEAMEYIDVQVEKGNMSAYLLKHFHQDFVYWFFNVLKQNGIKAHTVFSQDENSKYNYDALMNSYTSIDRIKNLIVFTTSYLKELSGQNDNQGDRIEEIVEYIHQNIQKNITRKDLADAVYLNPEYLSRLFKKEKGCTLSEFILKEKMNIAKSLLETTGFSVSIIASKVGYSNFSHFAQCFKKEFGVSPSEFRQKAK